MLKSVFSFFYFVLFCFVLFFICLFVFSFISFQFLLAHLFKVIYSAAIFALYFPFFFSLFFSIVFFMVHGFSIVGRFVQVKVVCFGMRNTVLENSNSVAAQGFFSLSFQLSRKKI